MAKINKTVVSTLEKHSSLFAKEGLGLYAVSLIEKEAKDKAKYEHKMTISLYDGGRDITLTTKDVNKAFQFLLMKELYLNRAQISNAMNELNF